MGGEERTKQKEQKQSGSFWAPANVYLTITIRSATPLLFGCRCLRARARACVRVCVCEAVKKGTQKNNNHAAKQMTRSH